MIINNNLKVNTSSKHFNVNFQDYLEEKRILIESMKKSTPKTEIIKVEPVAKKTPKKKEPTLSKEDNVKNDDFLNLINKLEEEENKLFSLVPTIHKSAVRNLVKTQFQGSLKNYLETIPLFFDPLIWNKRKKDDADEKFLTNKSNREKKAYKKSLILHSAQLLKLVGYGRQKIATKAMVKEYVEDMENSDDYINNLRLINPKGKIIKLESNKEKQFKKLARMNKIADTLDLLAKDKGFTNSMITMTLPPSYHPNPQNNNCSYNGATPQKAKQLLTKFWQAFRAKLSNAGFVFNEEMFDTTGKNLFGLSVIELQGDSTLHLHSMFYHSKEDEELLTQCLCDVEDNYNKKQTNPKDKLGRIDKNGKYHRGFDISYSNQNINDVSYQRGSSYMMKYLYKTHTTYDDKKEDDEALKNQAGRWLYGVRSFNFFGFDGSIGIFEFLAKHYKAYENTLPDEIKNCIKTGDLYTFIKHYASYFTNEWHKEGKKKTRIGIVFSRGLYKKSNDRAKQEKLVLDLLYKLEKEIEVLETRMKMAIKKKDYERLEQLERVKARKVKKIESIETTNEVIQDRIDEILESFELVLIQKNVFSIFQSNEESKDLDSITSLNLDDLANANIKHSFDNVVAKQDELDFMVSSSVEKYLNQNINLLTLSKMVLINQQIENKTKNLNKSIVVQLFKAIQVGRVSPDKREKFRQDVLNKLNL